MAKKKGWFTVLKRLFLSDARSRLDKKDHKTKKWAFRFLKMKSEKPLIEDGKHVQLSHGKVQEFAATKIQAAFRGYLGRKALGALKGVVKLQALIRGWAVRRQAVHALKCLQSIVNMQSDVCSKRMERITDSSYRQALNPPAIVWSSNWNHKFNNFSAKSERGSAQLAERDDLANSDTNPRNRDDHSKHSQKPGAETSNSPTYVRRRSFSRRKQHSTGESIAAIPAYMASTESAKAKARSSSTPRQRPMNPDVCSETSSPRKHYFSPTSSMNSEVASRSWVRRAGSFSQR